MSVVVCEVAVVEADVLVVDEVLVLMALVEEVSVVVCVEVVELEVVVAVGLHWKVLVPLTPAYVPVMVYVPVIQRFVLDESAVKFRTPVLPAPRDTPPEYT